MNRLFPLLAVVIIALSALPQKTEAQVAFIDGVVVNAQGQPLPGVTVSLVHQFVGRSTPSTTNLTGYFYFTNVPMNQVPYYLEIYWGTQLIYRNTLLVGTPVLHLGAVAVQ